MNKTVKSFILFILLVMVISGTGYTGSSYAKAETNIPNNYFNDYTSILNDSQRENLNNVLRNYSDKSTIQIIGVFLKSLNGEDINDYSFRIFGKLKIGQKYVNNGALVVIALQERKLRISTGYGLEWPISDDTATQIITEMVPFLKAGNYHDAFLTGFNRIIDLTKDFSWKIEYIDLDDLIKNKESALSKIASFKAKLIKITDNQINVTTPTNQEAVVNTTLHMKDLTEKIANNKDFSVITARLIMIQPLTFNLLGIDDK
jgi:hypothetical protein